MDVRSCRVDDAWKSNLSRCRFREAAVTQTSAHNAVQPVTSARGTCSGEWSAIRTCWWGSVRRAVASTSSASAASLSTRRPYGYTAKVRWPWATNRPRLPARPAGAIRLVERPESDRRSRPAVPAQRPNAAGDPDRDSAVAQVTARWEAYLGRRRMEQRRTTPSRRQTLCRPLTQTAAITRPTTEQAATQRLSPGLRPSGLAGTLARAQASALHEMGRQA
jgi:hypothetical protein